MIFLLQIDRYASLDQYYKNNNICDNAYLSRPL